MLNEFYCNRDRPQIRNQSQSERERERELESLRQHQHQHHGKCICMLSMIGVRMQMEIFQICLFSSTMGIGNVYMHLYAIADWMFGMHIELNSEAHREATRKMCASIVSICLSNSLISFRYWPIALSIHINFKKPVCVSFHFFFLSLFFSSLTDKFDRPQTFPPKTLQNKWPCSRPTKS